MIDLLQLQDDVFALLLGAPALRTVNIVQERRFIVESQVEMDAIWQTVRNGRSGCGILCEMPALNVTGKNSVFPANLLELGFVCFQNGDAALAPETGSGLTAEHLAALVLDLLHHQRLEGVGTLYAEEKAVTPAREFEFIASYRVTLLLKTTQTNQTLRCAPVSITNNSGTVTLACATSGAAIYYTLDGSAPHDPALTEIISGNVLNPAAQTYTAPFAVTSGQRVRAVATAFGYNASFIGQLNIT